MSARAGVNSRSALGFARWWARWWLDTCGVFAGVALPALFAVPAGALDLRAIPLG